MRNEKSTVNVQYSDQELLDLLRKKAKEIGKTPSIPILKADSDFPVNTTIYIKRFKSWNNAIAKAGLEITQTHSDCKKNHYTNEELLELLRQKAEEIGHTPSTKLLDKDPKFPVRSGVYRLRFGTWNDAIKKAGLEINQYGQIKYSDQELLEKLQEKSRKLERIPIIEDIWLDKEMPSSTTYLQRFGSWKKALKKAGIL